MNSLRRRHSEHRLGPESEEGAVGILSVGLVLVLLLVIATVAAVTSVYIAQRKLQLLADECSDASTTRIASIDQSAGSGPRPVLDAAGVRGTAQTVLAQTPAAVDQASVADARVVDGQTATVVLTGQAHPPILTLFLPKGVQVTATSTSRVVVEQ